MKSFSRTLITIIVTAIIASALTCRAALIPPIIDGTRIDGDDIIVTVRQFHESEAICVLFWSTDMVNWEKANRDNNVLNRIVNRGSQTFDYILNDDMFIDGEMGFFRIVQVERTICSVTNDLTVGSSGSEVVILKGWLIEGGYLVMPAGYPVEYFGPLTQSALAAYQASVGISPAAGYFGPITRAVICGEQITKPMVELIDVDSGVFPDEGWGSIGSFMMELEVTNLTDDDFYITSNPFDHWGLVYQNRTPVELPGPAILGIIESPDQEPGDTMGWFVVKEGRSRTFTSTTIVMVDEKDEEGIYQVFLEGITWARAPSWDNWAIAWLPVPFKTESEWLSGP